MKTSKSPNLEPHGQKSQRGGRRSTSWKRGQSGNPSGRPRLGLSWKSLLAEFAERETPPALRQFGKTWGEALIQAAFRQAIEGNDKVLHEILERSDNSPAPPPPSGEDSPRASGAEDGDQQIEQDRQRLERWRGDPERQKRLADLQAQQLELERQVRELVSAQPGAEDGQADATRNP